MTDKTTKTEMTNNKTDKTGRLASAQKTPKSARVSLLSTRASQCTLTSNDPFVIPSADPVEYGRTNDKASETRSPRSIVDETHPNQMMRDDNEIWEQLEKETKMSGDVIWESRRIPDPSPSGYFDALPDEYDWSPQVATPRPRPRDTATPANQPQPPTPNNFNSPLSPTHNLTRSGGNRKGQNRDWGMSGCSVETLEYLYQLQRSRAPKSVDGHLKVKSVDSPLPPALPKYNLEAHDSKVSTFEEENDVDADGEVEVDNNWREIEGVLNHIDRRDIERKSLSGLAGDGCVTPCQNEVDDSQDALTAAYNAKYSTPTTTPTHQSHNGTSPSCHSQSDRRSFTHKDHKTVHKYGGKTKHTRRNRKRSLRPPHAHGSTSSTTHEDVAFTSPQSLSTSPGADSDVSGGGGGEMGGRGCQRGREMGWGKNRPNHAQPNHPSHSSYTPRQNRFNGSVLEKHKQYARHSLMIMSDGGERTDTDRPLFKQVKRGTFGRRTALESPGGANTSNLVIGILTKQRRLHECDLLIDDRYGQLRVVDAMGKLGLGELPSLAGSLQKKKSTSIGLFPWNTRFVVIQQCSLYWFHSRKDFLTRGVSAATGSLSLIIFKCTVDMVANHSRQFIVRVSGPGREFVFDSWRSDWDRGKWLVILLAHNHKAYEVRTRFHSVDWAKIQEEALMVGGGSGFWKTGKVTQTSFTHTLRRLSNLIPTV
eukprot:GHVN01057941.1.p1 GENE.GHVN01057941.1~~GHVN01057941.1.p1  ORF type:complete len:705 (-),score=135.43 GHVN01057941.1:1617-3731(-)